MPETLMSKKDFETFATIRLKKKLNPDAVENIAYLHAKYFKHKYFKPCTCSGKTWQQWIAQLNTLWDNGYS